jgi:hypothetical protein
MGVSGTTLFCSTKGSSVWTEVSDATASTGLVRVLAFRGFFFFREEGGLAFGDTATSSSTTGTGTLEDTTDSSLSNAFSSFCSLSSFSSIASSSSSSGVDSDSGGSSLSSSV